MLAENNVETDVISTKLKYEDYDNYNFNLLDVDFQKESDATQNVDEISTLPLQQSKRKICVKKKTIPRIPMRYSKQFIIFSDNPKDPVSKVLVYGPATWRFNI